MTWWKTQVQIDPHPGDVVEFEGEDYHVTLVSHDRLQSGAPVTNLSIRLMGFHRSLTLAEWAEFVSKPGTSLVRLGQRQERITAVALKLGDVVVTVQAPARHDAPIREGHQGGIPREWVGKAEQGFLTSLGRFVDREQAASLAREQGQIVHKTGPSRILFSEDVW